MAAVVRVVVLVMVAASTQSMLLLCIKTKKNNDFKQDKQEILLGHAPSPKSVPRFPMQ